MRVRTVVLLLAGAFLLWNAVYDHVVVVAGDLYIIVARTTAGYGVEARVADWMHPARTLAFAAATTISVVALGAAAAAAFARRLIRAKRARPT